MLHSHFVLSEIDELESGLKDAGYGVLGYVLTGRQGFLDRDRRGMEQVAHRLASLRRRTRDNPEQQAEVARIEQAVKRWLAVLQETIRLREEKGMEAARERILEGRHRQVRVDLWNLVDAFKEKEKQLFRQRMEETGASLQWGIASFAIAMALALALLIALYAMARRDIAERRRAEDSVRAGEERVRLLLESTGEGIYGIDLDGRCTFCNPACVHLLGYAAADDLLGKEMHPLVHHTRPDGTPLAALDCRICQALRQGTVAHVSDEVFWRADGTSFPTEYRSHPIYRAGERIGAVVTFADITRRVQRRGGDAAPRPGAEGDRAGHPDLGPGTAREPGHLCQRCVRAADRLRAVRGQGAELPLPPGAGDRPGDGRGAPRGDPRAA